MAGRLSNLVMSLPKFGHAGATIARIRTWNPMVFGAATPRPINQVPNSNEKLSSDATGTGENMNVTADENNNTKAYSTAPQNMKHKAREVGSEMLAKAENVGEKAKQAMQDACDSTKNSAQRAAGTVLGKAQESADSLKQNADSLKKSFNSTTSSSN